MANYGRTISSQLSLLCAHKTSLKKSDYVIHRKCILSNKSKIEEMEDQVLIPGENAHYLLLILIIHIGGLFPFPIHSKLNTPDKGDIDAKFDVDYLTFPFHRSDQTGIFRRIISVHSG